MELLREETLNSVSDNYLCFILCRVQLENQGDQERMVFLDNP